MSDPIHAAALPETSRRWLLRGGAVAAGAAVLAAAAPPTALAADGDAATLGETNESTATTTFTLTGADAATNATVALTNADGPTLSLEPSADWENPPALELGQIANTILGPVIGVDSFDAGLVTSYLATGIDLDDLPTPYALPKPVRVLDTRSSSGRAGIVRTSSGAIDSSGRLRARSWIDVEVAVEDGSYEVPAVFLNAGANADTPGYLSVYPPGPFPGTSTITFPARQWTSSAAFIATSIVLGGYAVRVYSSALTHLTLDLTGATIKGAAPTPVAAKAQNRTSTRSQQQGSSQGRRTRLAERLLSRLSR